MYKLMIALLIGNIPIKLLSQTVGIGTNNPAPSAVLDLSSTTHGLLLPRIPTASRNAIQNPPGGLTIYNSSSNTLRYFNGTSWVATNVGNQNDINGLAVLYGMETSTQPYGGYAFGLNASGSWIQQTLQYVNQGYRDTFSRTQLVVYGMETSTAPRLGYAYAFTQDGNWIPQTLPYVNQGYRATASANQVVIFGMETSTQPYGGFAFGISPSGTWVQQILPYVNQGYKSIASNGQIVIYGIETSTAPRTGYAFAFTQDGTWIQQTLPYVN